jgi:hypothetical protein
MTPLDRLVDDVARQMTSARPSPNLRARTAAAIAVRPAPHWWWKLAVPVCAIALLAGGAIVLVQLRVSMPDVRARAPHVLASSARPVPALDIVFVPAPPAPARRPPATTAALREWNARRIPTLAAPTAIETVDIQPDELQVPLLQLKPLATDPLAIEPIPGGR